MSAINKMEHYLNSVDRMEVSFADILLKCRALAQEEKAEAPVNDSVLSEDTLFEIKKILDFESPLTFPTKYDEGYDQGRLQLAAEIEEVIAKHKGGAK